MVAIAYDSLGSISGVSNNTSAPYAKRGRDKESHETFIFQCDPLNPFTGTIHIQGSVNAPTDGDLNRAWADIANVVFGNEGGTHFVQLDVKLTAVRAVCKSGNYVSGKITKILAMR